jgi:hypothetical protein
MRRSGCQLSYSPRARGNRSNGEQKRQAVTCSARSHVCLNGWRTKFARSSHRARFQSHAPRKRSPPTGVAAARNKMLHCPNDPSELDRLDDDRCQVCGRHSRCPQMISTIATLEVSAHFDVLTVVYGPSCGPWSAWSGAAPFGTSPGSQAARSARARAAYREGLDAGGPRGRVRLRPFVRERP